MWAATAARRRGARSANTPPERLSSIRSTAATCSAARPKLLRMSAKITLSPALGTPYSTLAGIIVSARLCRDRRCSADKADGLSGMVISIEQGGQAPLDVVGDI